MGFHSCRNLSVVLLAGLALVGCNNTPDKPKNIIGSNPTNPGGLDKQGLGQQWANPNQPYPIKNLTPLQNTPPNLGINSPPPGGPIGQSVAPVPSVGGTPPSFPPYSGGSTQPTGGVRASVPNDFAIDPRQPNTGSTIQPILPPPGFQK